MSRVTAKRRGNAFVAWIARMTMSIESIDAGPGRHDDDLPEHIRTYRWFLGFLKWNVLAIAIVLILLAAWAG
jgi:hypothetical protein